MKGLTEAIYGYLGDQDLIVENIFFKIYKIYSQEELLDALKSHYQGCSVIKFQLSDEIKMQILGDAKTIGEVKSNVEIYCKIEYENKIKMEKTIELEKAMQKQLALEKNPLYRLKMLYNRNPEVIVLSVIAGMGCLVTFFMSGSDVIQEQELIRSSLRELISIARTLINAEANITEYPRIYNRDAMVAALRAVV